MKHKNVYAYLFFAAAIGAGNSAWAMEPVVEEAVEGADEIVTIVRPTQKLGTGQLALAGDAGNTAGQTFNLNIGGGNPRSIEDEVELKEATAKIALETQAKATVQKARATVEAAAEQGKVTEEKMPELQKAIDQDVKLQVHAIHAQEKALKEIKGAWHAEKDIAAGAVKTFVTHTAKSSGETFGKRLVEAPFAYFDPVAQAQKQLIQAQALQGKMAVVGTAAQLKGLKYTDEEYLRVVLINNPQLAERYEKHHFSTEEELQKALIEKLYPNFGVKNAEEQSTIKELVTKKVTEEKKEINAKIAKLVARQKYDDEVQSAREKMEANESLRKLKQQAARAA
jgi:hypothetical protein